MIHHSFTFQMDSVNYHSILEVPLLPEIAVSCKVQERIRTPSACWEVGTNLGNCTDLSDAIRAGKEHTSLLLNYTRTGTPFWNREHCPSISRQTSWSRSFDHGGIFRSGYSTSTDDKIPLKNAHGGIDFFLGAQINVSNWAVFLWTIR